MLFLDILESAGNGFLKASDLSETVFERFLQSWKWQIHLVLHDILSQQGSGRILLLVVTPLQHLFNLLVPAVIAVLGVSYDLILLELFLQLALPIGRLF